MLSGLGADERVFINLKFNPLNLYFVKWIEPMQNETISSYAKRLCLQLEETSPILIGLSFGGIMAVEISKIIDTEQIILLSSAKTKYEIPFIYRLAGKLHLNRYVPISMLKTANIFSYWLFNIKSKEEKELFKQILKDTDPVFLKWAIDKIVNWKNTIIPQQLIHIHGTKDKILPMYFIKNKIRIQGGGHLMVLNKADEVSSAIAKCLSGQSLGDQY